MTDNDPLQNRPLSSIGWSSVIGGRIHNFNVEAANICRRKVKDNALPKLLTFLDMKDEFHGRAYSHNSNVAAAKFCRSKVRDNDSPQN